MAPEWVGDVMNSAIGWLLDVTLERNAATLWIKTTQGGILRLADRYQPCFYILSRNIAAIFYGRIVQKYPKIPEIARCQNHPRCYLQMDKKVCHFNESVLRQNYT